MNLEKNVPINEFERNKMYRDEFKKLWNEFKTHYKPKDFIKKYIELNPTQLQIGIETKINNVIYGRNTPTIDMIETLHHMIEIKKNQIEVEKNKQTNLDL